MRDSIIFTKSVATAYVILIFFFGISSGEEVKEQMRREIVETKRAMNEEAREKELVGKTADELRGKVKKAEADKTEMNRVIQEAKQRISGMNYLGSCVQCILPYFIFYSAIHTFKVMLAVILDFLLFFFYRAQLVIVFTEPYKWRYSNAPENFSGS